MSEPVRHSENCIIWNVPRDIGQVGDDDDECHIRLKIMNKISALEM